MDGRRARSRKSSAITSTSNCCKLWDTTGKTVTVVTHSIPEAVFLSNRIVVICRRGRDESSTSSLQLSARAAAEIRETPEFLKIAQRCATGLRAGHSYDE